MKYNPNVPEIVSAIKSNNPDLKEAEIIGLLYILREYSPMTNTKLVQLTGLPKTLLRQFKASISGFFEDSNDDRILLSSIGLEKLAEIKLEPYKWTLLTLSNYQPEKISEIRKKYNLEPQRDLDQFFATEESTLKKVQSLKDKGMITGKNIALIGDDDLVSVALALFEPTYNSIKVFDVDEKILDVINKISKDYGLSNINTFKQDVRADFNKEELHKYDVVLIDPPYTKTGVELFLYRSLELLNNFKNFYQGYIFLNFGVGRRNPEKEAKIQYVINSMGLVIEDKINNYISYNGAETIGSASSLYILNLTPFSKVTKSITNTKIYTFEETDTETFPYVDHFVFKLQKIPARDLTSKKLLLKNLGDFCRKHKLNVLDTKITKFKGGGLTITYVLGQSNLVVHTWPEKESLHLDLITCTPIYNRDFMNNTLSQLFNTKFIETRQIE